MDKMYKPLKAIAAAGMAGFFAVYPASHALGYAKTDLVPSQAEAQGYNVLERVFNLLFSQKIDSVYCSVESIGDVCQIAAYVREGESNTTSQVTVRAINGKNGSRILQVILDNLDSPNLEFTAYSTVNGVFDTGRPYLFNPNIDRKEAKRLKDAGSQNEPEGNSALKFYFERPESTPTAKETDAANSGTLDILVDLLAQLLKER